MLAVKMNRPVIVEKLLAAGADPYMKDKLGQEAMDYHFSLEEIETLSSLTPALIAAAKEKYQ